MVFASKVNRTDSLNHRNKSLSNAVKGVKSAYAIIQGGGGQRPNTTADGLHPDVDIFEDDDEDVQPGPGAYYNPK